MHMSIHEKGKLIGPYEIFTDGVWMWPSYIFHFIERFPNIKIDISFVEYVKAKNFKIDHFDLEEAKVACDKEIA
jgi:hypothetical protein